MKNPEQVWYASYGSNILESRFHCYIAGGRPKGATRTYLGCRDKTLPADKREIYISSEVYFAREAKTWNGGGVAFIKNEFDENVQSPGRMYLISSDQFEDVVKQEIGMDGQLEIDLKGVRSKGSLVIEPGAWYGKIIFLGEQDGHPIFTFTSDTDLTNQINPPHENYLLTIIRGLLETHQLSDSDLVSHFKSLQGIANNEVAQSLDKIVERAHKVSD